MQNTVEKAATAKPTLGKYLASIREDRGLKLREVEAATGKEVSNAYLSQIENEKIKKPSPNVLHALSTVYKISYEQLMEMAGYAVTSTRTNATKRSHAFGEHNLSAEEEAKLLEYLRFIRSQK